MKSVFLIASALLLTVIPSKSQEFRTVKCRLVLFEKTANDKEDIFAFGKKESEFIENKLNISVETSPVEYVVPTTGKISFLASRDPKSQVLATATIPENIKDAYLFFMPNIKSDGSPDDSIRYKVLVLDDSEKSIPIGGASMSNLCQQDIRFTWGEMKIQLPSGRTTIVPQPKTRNDFDQAEFTMSYNDKGEWVPIKNTLQRCGNRDRYLMFVYKGIKGVPTTKIYSRGVPYTPTSTN